MKFEPRIAAPTASSVMQLRGMCTALAIRKLACQLRLVMRPQFLMVFFVWALLIQGAHATTVTAVPTSCVNATSIGTRTWSSPGNALINDTSYATVTVDDNEVSNFLQCTGFNFSIPANATVTGVTVNVNRHTNSTNNSSITRDSAVRLVKAGALGTTDRSTTTSYTTSDVIEAHGGATDLWGTTWTPGNINAVGFGLAFAAQKANTSSGARTISVDNFTISVDYTVPFSCTPPANTPPDVNLSCVCDTFVRSSLNPSTIFGSDWIVSTSDATGIVPSIMNSGYLRLTNNTGNNAKAASVPGIFPAAGNYISVEFQQYAYSGSGADGIAVTLSDYAVPAVPGAYGGSLGYAQKTGIDGFAGGWLGVALDEFGNYQNASEGRLGGPGVRVQSVGARGSGSGQTGYRWLGGTGSLTPTIDGNTSRSPGYYYQVVVDARNDPTSTRIDVNRDTGGGYASLISIPNVYAAATSLGFTQAAVPSNWQISFTGSTGSSTNIHEISGLRICAQTVYPPSGGAASGFNAIDDAYGNPSLAVQNYLTGHLYMKLVGVPFKLNVAALNNNQIQTAYVASGTKNVAVKLVDNSDNACILNSTQANYCSSACTSKSAVTSGSQTLSFTPASAGQKQSADFTLNTAYKSLVAIISEGSTTACATDSFSVRPTGVALVTSSNATNATTSGTPAFKAGGDAFALTATTTGVSGSASGYTGTLKINNSALQVVSPATVPGSIAPAVFSAATTGTGSSAASGATFTYTEVGGFVLPGYNPASDATSVRGVYDGVQSLTDCASMSSAQCDSLKLSSSWTGVDSVSTAIDCIVNSYSNTKVNGKYGCNFGLITNSGTIGRFYPHHFDTNIPANACGAFTYSGQPFKLNVTAKSATGNTTLNYAGNLAKTHTYSDGNGAIGNFIPATLAANTFASGVADLTATAQVSFTYTNKLTAPSILKLRVTDEDGASSATGSEGSTPLRSGRVRISNIFGSEKSDLLMPVQAQYWSGNSWVLNNDDGCTSLPASAFYLGGSTLSSVSAGVSLVGGTGTLTLKKPNPVATGSIDVAIDLGASGSDQSCLPSHGGTAAALSWLRSQNGSCTSTYDRDPSARATFGIYSPETKKTIHVRELY